MLGLQCWSVQSGSGGYLPGPWMSAFRSTRRQQSEYQYSSNMLILDRL